MDPDRARTRRRDSPWDAAYVRGDAHATCRWAAAGPSIDAAAGVAGWTPGPGERRDRLVAETGAARRSARHDAWRWRCGEPGRGRRECAVQFAVGGDVGPRLRPKGHASRGGRAIIDHIHGRPLSDRRDIDGGVL